MTHLEALKIALEKFDLKYIDEWVSEALIICKGSSDPKECITNFLRAKKAEQEEKKKLKEEQEKLKKESEQDREKFLFIQEESFENEDIKIKL